MTDRICRGCGDNLLHDQLEICTRCGRQTSQRLGEQAAHRQDLVVAMSRMVRMNAPNDGARPTADLSWNSWGDRYLDTITDRQVADLARTLPPARAAANAIHAQRSLLVSWAKFLAEECSAGWPKADSVAAIACHIEANLNRLRIHEAGPDLVLELRDLERQVVKAIDSPEHRTQIPVGPCPLDIEGVPCPGEVRAFFPRDMSERPVMRCQACRMEWFAEQWDRVGELILRRRNNDRKASA